MLSALSSSCQRGMWVVVVVGGRDMQKESTHEEPHPQTTAKARNEEGRATERHEQTHIYTHSMKSKREHGTKLEPNVKPAAPAHHIHTSIHTQHTHTRRRTHIAQQSAETRRRGWRVRTGCEAASFGRRIVPPGPSPGSSPTILRHCGPLPACSCHA